MIQSINKNKNVVSEHWDQFPKRRRALKHPCNDTASRRQLVIIGLKYLCMCTQLNKRCLKLLSG